MAEQDSRPNPDQLLARVQAEEARSARGRLKVFFGSSAGVGKTYAMLQAAHAQKQAGVDVLVGYIETHRRQETEALLDGLPLLPRKQIEYKGARLPEFDLDGALAAKPQLILVDELAHTNAPGSRHSKRWQDVLELVDAGVNVYTTVNVQHLSSLNDVVTQVTGVVVRETVPDFVLDQADEIELIDLPAEDLLKRLGEGKVYLGEQAQRATEGFFRAGNLIALRELALRQTADRVDTKMREYRQSHAIENTWPVSERLLVAVGPSPFSAQLVRATARMAAKLGAEWIAAFVETPEFVHEPEATRARVLSTLRLAEQLGAKTVTLTGAGVSAALLHYARSVNVTTVVAGKPREPLWQRLFRRSLIDDLMEASGDIDIHALHGERERGAAPPPRIQLGPPSVRDHLLAFGAVVAATAVAYPLRSVLAPANLVMIYLMAVVGVAMRASRRTSFLASVLSVAAFDFFCVPPYFSFAVSDTEYILTFVVMLSIALIISDLTVRIREQAARAVGREARTQSLYRFTRELAAESQIFEIARRATGLTEEAFGCPVMLLLPESGRINFKRRTTDRLLVPVSEEGIAQWVFDHDQRAGKGTDTLSGAHALYMPVRAAGPVLGVMAVIPTDADLTASPEQMNQLAVFATLTAQAMERASAAMLARDSEVRIRTEEMRSSLLSAVSHDLRTPLASITGAATSLLGQGDRFTPETRHELLESIADEAERLGRLVNNLLEMTRLGSGTVEIHRDWHSLEEIVGATLNRLAKLLSKHPVKAIVPATLPLVQVDEVLIEQVLVNLLENAAKYTPESTEIEIECSAAGSEVITEVRDRGPGFDPVEANHLFEKFYRGKSSTGRGVGLGLAIAHAIVRAHGGRIQALNRSGGGTIIRFMLPGAESMPAEAPSQ